MFKTKNALAESVRTKLIELGRNWSLRQFGNSRGMAFALVSHGQLKRRRGQRPTGFGSSFNRPT